MIRWWLEVGGPVSYFVIVAVVGAVLAAAYLVVREQLRRRRRWEWQTFNAPIATSFNFRRPTCASGWHFIRLHGGPVAGGYRIDLFMDGDHLLTIGPDGAAIGAAARGGGDGDHAFVIANFSVVALDAAVLEEPLPHGSLGLGKQPPAA